MNKKINSYLNFAEIGSVLVGILCLIAALKLLPTLDNKKILETTIFIVGMLANAVLISIEMIEFLVYKLKYRVFYAIFMLIDLILLIYINTKLPFSGVLVLFGMCMLKAALRITYTDEIFVPKKLDKYLLIYGIKLKKTKKKSTVRNTVKNKKNVSVTKNKAKKAKEVTEGNTLGREKAIA